MKGQSIQKGGIKKMGNQKYLRSAAGFTLIELVIVMVVLAVMAGLAIPKFMDLREDAKYSAVQGALGGVRSAVANFHAKNIATNPDDTTPYPADGTELSGGTVINGTFPDNPFYTGVAAKNSIGAATGTKGTVGCNAVPLDVAWCYKVTNPGGPAEFWASTQNSTKTVKEKDL